MQAADITSQVLNFGLSAPIDVQIQGRDAAASYRIAQQLATEMRTIPGAVDVRIPPVFDYPTLMVNIDRDKAMQLGFSEFGASHSLLDSLASSVAVSPNNWLVKGDSDAEPSNAGAAYQPTACGRFRSPIVRL